MKLSYLSPYMHHSGGTVCEPVDIPVNKRHLDMVYAHLRYSDKAFMGSVTHPERAEETVAMAKVLFGEDFLRKKTVVTSLINANSPMTFDATMLGAAKVYARNNQACIVSPFILSGAMSPVTAAGTLAQILAEVLAGVCLLQLIAPGAPCVFGTFSSSISMQSGAPTFGSPEAALVVYGAGQLARRLGLPYRSGGALSASKIADAQAAFESANHPAAHLAGRRKLRPACGGLAGGRAGDELREVRHGPRSARHDANLQRRRGSIGKRPSPGRHPRSRPRQPLSRLRPHPGQLRHRLLPVEHQR